MGTSRTVADLVSRISSDPGRPRITWYAPGGERVELSGRVVENWVAKTTNLLVEELDAEPGVRILIDMPAHWKQIVWALSAWRAGATVVLADDLNEGAFDSGADEPSAAMPDVVVTSYPERWTSVPRATRVVAVALPSLARAWDGELPAGIMDGVAEVPLFDDVLGWTTEAAATDIAVEHIGDRERTFADLLNYAATFAKGRGRSELPLRMLIDGGDPYRALFAVVGILSRDGSAVLLDVATAAELGADSVRRQRLIETERVTL